MGHSPCNTQMNLQGIMWHQENQSSECMHHSIPPVLRSQSTRVSEIENVGEVPQTGRQHGRNQMKVSYNYLERKAYFLQNKERNPFHDHHYILWAYFLGANMAPWVQEALK